MKKKSPRISAIISLCLTTINHGMIPVPLILPLLFVAVFPCLCEAFQQEYILHENVTVTIFWVGEAGGGENGYIPNSQSAWDEKWQEHYGGVDDPDDRAGYFPADFTPLENPFYFALPYNDFNSNGARKSSAFYDVYWAGERDWGCRESMCKNRWIKIVKGEKTAYAQWEDAGPFGEDDAPYVFGQAAPANQVNGNAGLDVSPAVRDYLGLSDIDKVSWRFVDFEDVPDGPWKRVITGSGIYWDDGEPYARGFEAGRQYCISQPSRCGIRIDNDNETTNGGIADQDGAGGDCAFFDFSGNSLRVPCFYLDGGSFWLDLKIISTSPVRLELSGYGAN